MIKLQAIVRKLARLELLGILPLDIVSRNARYLLSLIQSLVDVLRCARLRFMLIIIHKVVLSKRRATQTQSEILHHELVLTRLIARLLPIIMQISLRRYVR